MTKKATHLRQATLNIRDYTYMNLPFLSNLILRVEDAETNPHVELEDVSRSDTKLYIKDYDVFLLNSEKDVLEAILDAARIASEITVGQKFIHLSIQDETTPLRIEPELLRLIAHSGCTIEIR